MMCRVPVAHQTDGYTVIPLYPSRSAKLQSGMRPGRASGSWVGHLLGDLAAAHFRASDGQICAAEFHRGSQGWKLFKAASHPQSAESDAIGCKRFWPKADSLQDLFGSGKSLSSVEAGEAKPVVGLQLSILLSTLLKQLQSVLPGRPKQCVCQ